MSILSDRLKELRKKKGLTQKDLAEIIDVNRVTYTNWENGKRTPEPVKIVELATALDTTVDYLLGKTNVNYFEQANILLNELENNSNKRELSNEELERLLTIREEMMKNIDTIFSIGQKKFNMSDEEIAYFKFLILTKYLENNRE
ncbi:MULTISPECIES: helix-turn-helix domain-containing protein [Enterococcus]|uniref:Helix-turn-helix domain-containing protein n=2 Tax=Enterococcus TaxID=1350 RepID=A0ABD4ZRL8_ENTGA|nr:MULTISPECIES: helix-turn-helix domain-containing protein [Enterococcus]EGO2698117.1 helix-turn-helix transcriptional regulator [Enterococcus faecalis]EGO5198950.1 helix-turn-helix transcriptional regulator [Enterococcus faecalis]EGO7556101.1 helix-turn-helix transcriptional regulator [Enterococcus faecalis]EGO7928638.1 helix-turn-helix transcriptional regulator [Enterococcus faecalis]EGO8895425.1 XRE family transcriptional regulator [Enterococcus faecalis]